MQIFPNCSPATATRTVFELESGVRVIQCRGCGLQFAKDYPEIETADSEIYGAEYFAGAIEQRAEREEVFTELIAEIESLVGRKGRVRSMSSCSIMCSKMFGIHARRFSICEVF